jgi:hypothetical protein
VETMHQIGEFEESFVEDKNINIFIYDHSKCPKFENSIVISNYYYYNSNNYLNIPIEKFCFNFIDVPFVVYCEKFLIPLSFLIELILLTKGYSLIHAAAAKYKGKNYLFPAFGGVGKTTTISAIIYSGGKLFGDDMNIINERKILSYPSDFSIYPYHLDILKIENGFRIDKILDKIIEPLEKHKNYRAIKLLLLILYSIKIKYINMSPKKIFGENCIIKEGQIEEIYYLCRLENSLDEITVKRINSSDLAEICVNVLFQEWYQSMAILYTYSALSKFSLTSLFSEIKDIFRRTFAHYECYQIKIPSSLDNLNYQKQLLHYLSKNPL